VVADRDESVEVTLKCPAKINLFLEIGRKREDGYHEILTIFQTIDLYDELILHPGVSTGYFLSDIDLAWDGSNTLYKALKIVEKHLGKELALGMELKKKIPAGGGLGGGSSDAAALLRYLGETFHIKRETLFEMACSIGSDVPFFLRGGTAVGTGRGEFLNYPGDLEGYSVDLCFPGIEVSTALAYALLGKSAEGQELSNKEVEKLLSALRERDLTLIGRLSKNEFEGPVFVKFPEIERAYDKLKEKRKAITTRMTGSGSTLFSLFEGTEGEYSFVTSTDG
jgi:4-diphosphocytidyl-2-C-methyl-D-erythritol kinase